MRKLFFKHLPYDVTAAELHELIEQECPGMKAEKVFLIKANNDGKGKVVQGVPIAAQQSAGKAFVTVNDNAFIPVFQKFANKEILDKTGKVFVLEVVEAFDKVKKLYVGNLPWSVKTDEPIRGMFRGLDVSTISIIMDRENPGRSRGFAFVTVSEDSFEKILDQEWTLEDRVLNIREATEKPKEKRIDRNAPAIKKAAQHANSYRDKLRGDE